MGQRLKISGMNCEHCAGKVKDALEKVDGVVSASVSLESQTATVELSGDVAPDLLSAAVNESGYTFVGVE